MKIKDLTEARRNPEQNPKESPIDFLIRYADDTDTYVHFSNIHKVGINVKTAKGSSHDTPAGVYCYHLNTYKDILQQAKDRDVSFGMVFPYVVGYNMFVLRGSEPHSNTLQSYTQSDLDRDIEKLKEMYEPEFIDSMYKIAHTNENFVNAPIGYLYAITKAIAIGGTSELSHSQYPDASLWNTLLRKLGIEALHDTGYGFIHNFEQSQSLFLSRKAYTVIDHFKTDRKQSTVKIDGKEYKGGRLPKVLHLSRVDGTELANLDRSNPMLKKVERIVLSSASRLSDVKSLQRTFSNATVVISRISVRDIHDLEYMDNVVIERLVIERFPVTPTAIDELEKVKDSVNTIQYIPATLIRPLDQSKYSPELWNKITD